MAMDISAVMEGLRVRLATISDLNVYAYMPARIPVPAAAVGFPDRLDYDETFGRGADRATFPVHVFVQYAENESATDEIIGYMNGSGVGSVKAAIEAETTLGGAASFAVVNEAEVEVWEIAGVKYLAATFFVDVLA